MLPLPAGREASAGVVASVYERHRPELTLLYRLVEEHYPAFKAQLAATGTRPIAMSLAFLSDTESTGLKHLPQKQVRIS